MPVQPKYPHPRVEEFCHTGGVKDFVDFLSKGEAVSDIWRIAGEDTYVEETQAVGDDGELHAQKVTHCAVDIAMRWVNGYDTTIMQLREHRGDARRRHARGRFHQRHHQADSQGGGRQRPQAQGEHEGLPYEGGT